jgi:alkylated DNA repair protein alkB family protein 6
LLAAPLPAYLTNPILSRFKDLGIFDHTPHGQPNHVLINEYRPGEGIMPHEDGDAYAHVVATVSLGAGLCLDVLPKPESSFDKEGQQDGGNEGQEIEQSSPTRNEDNQQEKMLHLPTRIFQEPRSLLITTGRAYRELMHGISSIEVDEELSEGTVANWGLLSQEGKDAIARDGGRNLRGTRVSLTYRDVIKVSTAASRVLGVGRR